MEIIEVLEEKEKRRFIEQCDYAFPIGILRRDNAEEIILKIIDHAIFIGAYDESTLVGYCAFYANDTDTKTAYITMIGIVPEMQRKGMGSKLMDACLEKCKKVGMQKIRLEVLNTNIKAIEFYRFKGFAFERSHSENTSYYIRDVEQSIPAERSYLGKLRKLKKEDVFDMLEWMHDPAVNSKFRFDFGSMNEERALAFIESSFDDETQHFAFVDEYDEYLGTISLKHISQVDNNAEYAITTRTKAQGTGAAYAATMNILKYAFEELRLHRVYLNVLEENGRANAFYKKCGFMYEGQFKDHLLLRGEYKNLNWYGISEEEWKKHIR